MLMYKKLNLRLQLSEKIPFNEENISNEKYQENLVWKHNSNTYGTCGRRNKYVYKKGIPFSKISLCNMKISLYNM